MRRGTTAAPAPAPAPGPGPGPAPGPGGPKGGSTPRLGGGNTTPSPAREARTTINWIGAELPTDKAEGYAVKVLPMTALFTEEHKVEDIRLGRPSIVYFYSVKDDNALLNYEYKAFSDERVGVGSRLFNCVRINLDDMRSDETRKQYSKKGRPSIHVLDGDGKLVERFDEDATSHRLYKVMEAVVKGHYKIDLFKFLNQQGEILNVLDRTFWDIKLLEEDLVATKKHLEQHDCNHGRRQLAEITADIDKAKKERDEALAEEKKLFEPVS